MKKAVFGIVLLMLCIKLTAQQPLSIYMIESMEFTGKNGKPDVTYFEEKTSFVMLDHVYNEVKIKTYNTTNTYSFVMETESTPYKKVWVLKNAIGESCLFEISVIKDAPNRKLKFSLIDGSGVLNIYCVDLSTLDH